MFAGEGIGIRCNFLIEICRVNLDSCLVFSNQADPQRNSRSNFCFGAITVTVRLQAGADAEAKAPSAAAQSVKTKASTKGKAEKKEKKKGPKALSDVQEKSVTATNAQSAQEGEQKRQKGAAKPQPPPAQAAPKPTIKELDAQLRDTVFRMCA